MRRKPLPLLEKISIVDAGSEGKAIARVGELVVFVPFVVPGDVVDIQVIKKKKSFLEGRAVAFHTYSPLRIEPFCEHFGLCGGCRWQQMSYSDQLHFKQKQVKDAFERIGKLEFPEILPIIPSKREIHYRNKLEYTFSNRRWLINESLDDQPDMRGLGFHPPSRFDRIIDIRHCYLQDHPSDAIRLKARELCMETGLEFYDARRNQGFFRNLWIRNSNRGDIMIILVVSAPEIQVIQSILEALGNAFPEITSLMYVVNQKANDSLSDQTVHRYKGKGYLEEGMDGLVFRVGPVSFFQVNTGQAEAMYKTTRNLLDLNGSEIVYDLYTGTGTLAIFMARHAKKVVGIEYVDSAVEDARLNSQANQIDNTVFHTGDMAKILTEAFIEAEGRPDVIITDPPRAGMHEKVIEEILKAAPQKVAYISCNPATQARDLALLSTLYRIETVQPFDMFPHTQHVECLVMLQQR